MADARRYRAGQYQWGSRTSIIGKLLILKWCVQFWGLTKMEILNIYPAVIGCWTTEHLELNLMLFKLESDEHCKQNKGLRGRARDCDSDHKPHTKKEGSENKWLQGRDIYISLEGAKRTISGVQRPTGAFWTCHELGHYTKNCQRPRGNSDSQHDQGQTLQHGARGPVDTWADWPDFRMKIQIQILIPIRHLTIFLYRKQITKRERVKLLRDYVPWVDVCWDLELYELKLI